RDVLWVCKGGAIGPGDGDQVDIAGDQLPAAVDVDLRDVRAVTRGHAEADGGVFVGFEAGIGEVLLPGPFAGDLVLLAPAGELLEVIGVLAKTRLPPRQRILP